MARLIGIFGAAGFGREVAPLVRAQIAEEEPDAQMVFVEKVAGEPVNGIEVISDADFLGADRSRGFVVAIAEAALRRRLYDLAESSGATPFGVRAASAEVLDAVTLGPGAILCGHSTITSNTRVGRGFHLNIHSYLAHDCTIGDFVTFGPNVVCAGNVIVEDDAYIGAGALVRQGTADSPIIVGAGATVGMGAVVTRSVPPGTVVIGNPAKPFEK
jgi:sugar O-acyltransferase (sialic acid O-acetyltransferase NeuD family)